MGTRLNALAALALLLTSAWRVGAEDSFAAARDAFAREFFDHTAGRDRAVYVEKLSKLAEQAKTDSDRLDMLVLKSHVFAAGNINDAKPFARRAALIALANEAEEKFHDSSDDPRYVYVHLVPFATDPQKEPERAFAYIDGFLREGLLAVKWDKAPAITRTELISTAHQWFCGRLDGKCDEIRTGRHRRTPMEEFYVRNQSVIVMWNVYQFYRQARYAPDALEHAERCMKQYRERSNLKEDEIPTIWPEDKILVPPPAAPAPAPVPRAEF
jgi:hypothetical protein